MLGQRVSNEQTYVGPTKYVAVGPTLNQRLGFGWRMFSVLAGTCATMRGKSARHVVMSVIAYVSTFFKLCMHIT